MDRMAHPEAVQLGAKPLRRDEVVAVARDGVAVELEPAAVEAVTTARAHIEELANATTPTYGVSTGFGALARFALTRWVR